MADQLDVPLRLAIPKKGRIHDRVLELLKMADLKYYRRDRLDIATCTNFPLTMVFLPASDIPTYVAGGEIDLGITGEDLVEESGADVDSVLSLGIGKCRLCLLAPTGKFSGPQELAGKVIVTSFPRITRDYFSKLGVAMPAIRVVSGSVEAAVSLGLGDAVVDLVESGETARIAGLSVVESVLTTETILIKKKEIRPEHKRLVSLVTARIEGAVQATKFCMILYNIPTRSLPSAAALFPGAKGLTATPLQHTSGEALSAVNVLVARTQAGTLMDKLSAVGACDIVAMNLANSRANSTVARESSDDLTVMLRGSPTSPTSPSA